MEVSDILFSSLYQAFFCTFVDFRMIKFLVFALSTKIGQATYDLLLNFLVYR